MLEERIKRIQKSRPAPGVPVAAAPPPVQEPPQSASPLAANGSGLPRPGTNRNTTSGLMRMRYGMFLFERFIYLVVAVWSSGTLKGKQKLGVTFNFNQLVGSIHFTKFSKPSHHHF